MYLAAYSSTLAESSRKLPVSGVQVSTQGANTGGCHSMSSRHSYVTSDVAFSWTHGDVHVKLDSVDRT